MLIKFIVPQFFLFGYVLSISKHPILIVVSYDAFSNDYFHKGLVPNMERLRNSGTFADYLINVFPTKTFPNHHSIATGLYPDIHGVIGNSYFSSAEMKFVSMGYDMYHYSESVVPIWRWNEDQGNDHYSGSMMWPGANYAYQGKNITHFRYFDPGYDFFKRVDEVVSWITDPKKPANLIMFYIEEPDTHGHAFGTNSEVVKNIIGTLDNVTKYLEQQLEKYKLTDRVNVIHLSDHGMINVTPKTFVNVTQYLQNGTYYWGGASPCLQFVPKPGYEDKVYGALKNGSLINRHFKVFKKDEFLERWHYRNNKRSPPVLVMAEKGYALDDLILAAPKYAKKYHFNITDKSEFGVHGYDYEMMEMHPFFMARGPKIKKSFKVPPFNTIDLFNLFTEILEIPSQPNNGTKENIIDILIDNSRYNIGTIIIISIGGILVALFFISLIAAITLYLIKRQQNITTTAALNKRFPQTFQNNIIEAQHLLEPEDA